MTQVFVNSLHRECNLLVPTNSRYKLYLLLIAVSGVQWKHPTVSIPLGYVYDGRIT